MPHSRCLVLVSKYLIYLLISNKEAVFSSEICSFENIPTFQSNFKFNLVFQQEKTHETYHGYVHKRRRFCINKNVFN